VTSSLVVGVGGAGARMIATVKQMAESEGVSDAFEYLAIDSKTEDIEKHLPELSREQRIILDQPDGIADERNQRDYIPDDAELPDEGGATKTRGVGRYYLDDSNNFFSARTKTIDAFDRAARGAEYVNVWLVNALGGGTGSGTFPLVAALIRFAAKESDTQRNYRLRSVGTLPRLKESGLIQDKDFRHNINAYAAVRELRTLLGRNENVTAEQRLQLHDPPQDMRNEYLQVNKNQNLFDNYFLMGYDEEEPATNYRERMNKMVADLIFYYAMVEGPEDFPETDLPSGQKGDIYSLDSGEASIPLGTLYNYVEKKAKLTQASAQITAVENQADQFEVAHRFLNSVENVKPGEVPDEPPENERNENIAPVFVRECRDEARELVNFRDEDHLSELTTAAASTVADSQAGRSVQGKFDVTEIDTDELDAAARNDGNLSLSAQLEQFTVSDIAEFFILDQLMSEVKRIRNQDRSEFQTLVDDLWDTYSDEFEEHYPEEYADYAGTEHQNRAEGLSSFFDERLDKLRDKNESIFHRLDDEIDTRSSDRDELLEQYRTVKTSEQNVSIVRNKRQQAREGISNARDNFDKAADTLREEILGDLQADIDRLEEKRDEHLDALGEFSYDTHTNIPMTNLESLSPEDLAKWVGYDRPEDVHWWDDTVLAALEEHVESASPPSINQLLSDGYVTREDIERVCDIVMDQMDEQVEDREDDDEIMSKILNDQSGQTDPHPLLALLINNTNTENPNWKDRIESIGKQESNFMSFGSNSVSIRNQHSIRFLGIYSNLHFAKMSEYGKVHEYNIKADKRVSEAMRGDGNPAEELDEHLWFAYPELVDTGGGITKQESETEQL